MWLWTLKSGYYSTVVYSAGTEQLSEIIIIYVDKLTRFWYVKCHQLHWSILLLIQLLNVSPCRYAGMTSLRALDIEDSVGCAVGWNLQNCSEDCSLLRTDSQAGYSIYTYAWHPGISDREVSTAEKARSKWVSRHSHIRNGIISPQLS